MPIADVAGIVLAGGHSSRMGESKAWLEWHGSTLLRRAAGLMQRLGPVVVVRAPGQRLPALPPGVEVVDDARTGVGPLQGIATGLAAISAPRAFVCAVDMPFLHPAFARRVLRALTPDLDVVLPVARGHQQPLAAAYRAALGPRIEALIAAGRTRPGMVFEQVRVLRLDEAALLDDAGLAVADPGLDSLVNVNDPEDYRIARARAAPEVTVRNGVALSTVRAATLAGVGLPTGRSCILNGVPVGADPALPLVAGDALVLRP